MSDYFSRLAYFSGGNEVTVDLQTGWKTDPDAETAASLTPASVYPGGHHQASFSLVTSVSPASEMISMEMPPMGHIGQHHPPPHHQPQMSPMSPNYDGSDKKKRECEFVIDVFGPSTSVSEYFYFVLAHGLYLIANHPGVHITASVNAMRMR